MWIIEYVYRNQKVMMFIILLVTWGELSAQSQATNDDSSSVSTWKIGVVSGITVGAFLIGHVYLNNLWWKGKPSDFHINSTTDYTYALGADKMGHLTFAYAATTVYADAFRWCGMDSSSAVWSGAGVAMAYQTYIEIRDGFSADYGFSWGDVAANTIGAALPVVQHYAPIIRPLELQLSFWPSDAYREGAYNSIIDDYTSTTHWLAMSIVDWMPGSWQRAYPPWLGIAIGHSVENLNGLGGGNHVVYLSLDWNLARIPRLAPWLQSLLRIMHLYHLPAPAVKIYPTVTWYGLRF
jgi:hypothetical protein